jgi:hypothetical protein
VIVVPEPSPFVATISCQFCTWSARLAGDSPLEAVASLRQILINHVRDFHPDRLPVNGTEMLP